MALLRILTTERSSLSIQNKFSNVRMQKLLHFLEKCNKAHGLDQAAGWGLVSLAGFVFTYYSIWVIVLPFVEPHQPIHNFFLPRIYAIAGPLIAGVIALVLIGAFILYVTVSSGKKAKKS